MGLQAGQIANDVDFSDLLGRMPQYIQKSANQTVTNQITMVNDTELVVPVEADSVYEVEFFVWWGALLAAGIRTAWGVPAGVSANRCCAGPGTANAAEAQANTTEMHWVVHGVATQVGYTNPRNSVANQTWLMERGLIVVGSTPGNVTLQWSQNAANATGTVIYTPSYARYTKLS